MAITGTAEATKPLVISLLLVFILPESIQFLVLSGKDSQRAGKILRKIAPGNRYVQSEFHFRFAYKAAKASP